MDVGEAGGVGADVGIAWIGHPDALEGVGDFGDDQVVPGVEGVVGVRGASQDSQTV